MKFALITEGVSEHRVLKHIISKYFKNNEPEINQVQPKLIKEKQENDGGWDEVLKYCQRKELRDIFIENDYLVIQIDTDQSFLNPFNIAHTKQDENTGKVILKTFEELRNDVIAKIENLIDPTILANHKNNIFYAISIHTIECWLLPIYYTNKHRNDISTCVGSLNVELKKIKNLKTLPTSRATKNSANSIKTYNSILSNWKKRKEIDESAKDQYSLGAFLESLRKLD